MTQRISLGIAGVSVAVGGIMIAARCGGIRIASGIGAVLLASFISFSAKIGTFVRLSSALCCLKLCPKYQIAFIKQNNVLLLYRYNINLNCQYTYSNSKQSNFNSTQSK